MLSYKDLNLADLRSRFPEVLVGDPSPRPIPLAPAKIDSNEESEVETTVGPVSTISQEEYNTAFLVEVCLEELEQEKTRQDFSFQFLAFIAMASEAKDHSPGNKNSAQPSNASFPVAKEDLFKIKDQLLNRIEFLENQRKYCKIAKWKTSVRFPGEDEVDDWNQCIDLAPDSSEEFLEEHSVFLASCQPKKEEFGKSNLHFGRKHGRKSCRSEKSEDEDNFTEASSRFWGIARSWHCEEIGNNGPGTQRRVQGEISANSSLSFESRRQR